MNGSSWSPTPLVQKRRVFVSYHHGSRKLPGDQQWADAFRDIFSDTYEIFYDKSVTEAINSDDLEYVNRRIREDYITGSSVTLLLCGANTWRRKCVDWEIYSTLHQRHGLLGIALPTVTTNPDGTIPCLSRYAANWKRGYAEWMHWTDNPFTLQLQIESAISKSRMVTPDNSALKMARNL